MKKFNKTIYFIFLGLISLQSMVIAMKKEDIDDSVIEEFKRLNLNNNNIIEKIDQQEIYEQERKIDSSSVFDSQSISPLLPPQRSDSTPLELRRKIQLKPRSCSEERTPKKSPRRKSKVEQTLRTWLLRKIGENDYKKCKFIQESNFFNKAKNLLLTGIKDGLSCKIKSAIKLCPEKMRSKLLSEPLDKERLNLSPGSLLIGLHGKNFEKCKEMLMLLFMNDASELDGCTFLHAAAFFNCPKLIMYLLKEGLVNSLILGGKDEKVSALHCALKYKCFDAVRALIEFYVNEQKMLKAILNQRDSFLRTPLHYLLNPLFDGCYSVELEYSQKKDNIDIVNDQSDYQEKKLEMVKLLCKLGASVEAKDNHSLTPIDYAKKNENEKLLKILEEYKLLNKIY